MVQMVIHHTQVPTALVDSEHMTAMEGVVPQAQTDLEVLEHMIIRELQLIVPPMGLGE